MDFIVKAGPFVWPIIVASVIGLALFLERAFTFWRYRAVEGDRVREVARLVSDGDIAEAMALCSGSSDPVARVLETSLDTLGLPNEQREQIVAAAGNREVRQLERGVRSIAVIARITPLLGLLGTVVGLVEAFRAVSTMQGTPDPSVLASGIWQALLTTVAGLLVAIPAIISHEWLQSRIDEVALRMQEAVTAVIAAGAGRV